MRKNEFSRLGTDALQAVDPDEASLQSVAGKLRLYPRLCQHGSSRKLTDFQPSRYFTQSHSQ